MAYVSLYRKYRSQTFGDLIGQEHVVRTLQNGIGSGRISHAYLFTGPRGTGKTSSARLLAKCLCCIHGPGPEPCNECDNCVSITEGNCIDVVEMDAASQTGIDDVREKIIQAAEYLPAICRYKVFVIDEVHDLSGKAFDALLKTIEEPPSYMVFVLATTEYNKVPPTIRSRCQKFEFHRGSIQDLVQRLEYVAQQEEVKISPQALYAIARMADGGFRDALSLLEQAIIGSPSGDISIQDVYDQLGLVAEEMTDKIIEGVVNGNIVEITEVLAELNRTGRDPTSILESLMYRIADLTRIVFHVDKDQSADAAHAAASHELAVRMGQGKLLAVRGAITEAHRVVRDISLPRLWLESELIRISQMGQASPQPAVAAKPALQPAAQPKPAETTHPANGVAPARKAVVIAPKDDANQGGFERQELTGDPLLDQGIKLWNDVRSGLPERAPIAGRLLESRVAEFDGKKLVVEHQKIHIDWVQDPKVPGRIGLVYKEIIRIAGEEITLEFRVSKDGKKKDSEPGAVELPAEGPKLAQIAREVFGT